MASDGCPVAVRSHGTDDVSRRIFDNIAPLKEESNNSIVVMN